MSKRIYLSPSNQENNEGIGGYNEEIQMHILAERVSMYLLKSSVFQVRISNPSLTNKQVAKDSNDWGSDFHLCLHSDAGPEIAQGTTCFFYKTGGQGEKFANLLYKKVSAISHGKDRGCYARPELLELNSTNAPATLIENFFHTNKLETEHYLNNVDIYAREIAKAFYEFYDVMFVDIKNISIGQKAIIQSKCKFSNPSKWWSKIDQDPDASAFYKKWADSYL
jgi:N-acetylmuramoyl-L-alanine amidase